MQSNYRLVFLIEEKFIWIDCKKKKYFLLKLIQLPEDVYITGELVGEEDGVAEGEVAGADALRADQWVLQAYMQMTI